jgi:hypothetical protein
MDPDDPNPFLVLLSSMSAQELRKLERSNGSVTKGEAFNFYARAQANADAAFKAHVHGVKGFDLAGKAPENGAELLDALKRAPSASAEVIIADILDAIRDASVLKAGLLEQPGPPSES